MVDHSTLPSIADAKLPASYERAKTALSECSRIDECQEWADKARALASYAKQSKDDSLRKMAERIQSRAISRCGELLKQIEPGTGKYQSKREGDRPLDRKQAGDAAGMSDHQRKQALRVANIPREQFESLVESDNPPTVTKLAEMGKRQAVDLKGRDPKEFNKALHFVAAFERHLKECKKYDVLSTVDILDDSERSRLRKAIDKIDAIHDQIMTRI